MATIPTVQVWSTGQFVTAAQMNAGIGNVLSWLMSTPRAIVYRNQSTPWGSTTTPAVIPNWTTELVDTDTMFSLSNASRITFKTAGLFLVEYAFHFAIFTTGNAHCGVGLNTAGTWGNPNKLLETTVPNTGSNWGPSMNLTFSYFFNVGDYIEAFAAQNSGGSVVAFGGGAYFDAHFGAKWIATS